LIWVIPIGLSLRSWTFPKTGPWTTRRYPAASDMLTLMHAGYSVNQQGEGA